MLVFKYTPIAPIAAAVRMCRFVSVPVLWLCKLFYEFMNLHQNKTSVHHIVVIVFIAFPEHKIVSSVPSS